MLSSSRHTVPKLQERQRPNGDGVDPGTSPNPIARIRPRGTRVPEGARRYAKVWLMSHISRFPNYNCFLLVLTVREHDVKTCSRTSTTGDTRSTRFSWPPSPTSTALRWAHTEANRPKRKKYRHKQRKTKRYLLRRFIRSSLRNQILLCQPWKIISSFARILPLNIFMRRQMTCCMFLLIDTLGWIIMGLPQMFQRATQWDLPKHWTLSYQKQNARIFSLLGSRKSGY